MGWKHVFIKPTLWDILIKFAECAKSVLGQTHQFLHRNSDIEFILILAFSVVSKRVKYNLQRNGLHIILIKNGTMI